ncbi:MAG: (2Fe-2S)-binding protein [Tepidisphaeraceae bacterium]
MSHGRDDEDAVSDDPPCSALSVRPDQPDAAEAMKPSRRGFLRAASTSMVGLGLANDAWALQTMPATAEAPATTPSTEPTSTTRVSLTLNGQKMTLEVDPRSSLADTLRESLHLTGTKIGCNQGACGACTVHIDGQRVLSCLTLAASVSGKSVTTIEGLERLAEPGEELHPLQREFLQCDGYQCGYCTPGQIMSGVACIHEGHASGDEEELREWMSGNLCRCGAYPNIVQALLNAKDATLALADKEVR